MRPLTNVLLILVIGVWLASPALAQPPDPDATEEGEPTEEEVERARSHFNAGRQHYEGGRYAEAATEFSEAHRLTHHPDVLYNLAKSYDQLGRYEQALDVYRTYIHLVEDAPERGRIEHRMGELEALLAHSTDPQDESAPAPLPPAPPPTRDVGPPLASWIAFGVGAGAAVGATLTGVLSLGAETGDDSSEYGAATASLTGAAALGLGLGVILWIVDGGQTPVETADVALAPGPAPLGASATIAF